MTAKFHRRTLWVFRGLILVLLGWLGWYSWRRLTAPEPPEVTLDGDDPELEEAVEAARNRVMRSPYSAAAWGDMGMLLRGVRMKEPAGKCFAQAADLEPKEPRWAYLLGESYLPRDEESALPPLRRAAELWPADPPHVGPWLRLAEVLVALGQNDEAEKWLSKAQAIDPSNPAIHLQLGFLACEREDWEVARKHLLRCQSPFTQRRAFAQLAVVCRQLHQEKDADEYSARAARLPTDGDWVDPLVSECLTRAVGRVEKLRRVELLELRGDHQGAADLLREILARWPDATLWTGLGKNLMHLGDGDGAEQALQAALKLDADHVPAHYYLGQLAWARAEKAEAKKAETLRRQAIRHADDVLARKPGHAQAHLLRGRALRAVGDKTAGLDALRAAVRCGPELVDTHLYLGEALAEEGKIEEAREQLTKALRLADPDDRRPRLALDRLPRE